jgi:uncharacterized membrane protein YdjX (TVP38/TMEM64 family)
MPGELMERRGYGWAMLAVTLISMIVLPFVFFEGGTLRVADRALHAGDSPYLTGLAVVLLLASDIVLPIPSSVVSTAAGTLLGFVGGTIVSSIGMTLGCLGGYALGSTCGRRAAMGVVGRDEVERIEASVMAHGSLALLILRPIPVLAEASMISAGVLRVPFTKACLAAGAANIALSAWYAGFGAATDVLGLAVVFVGALLLPASAILLRLLFRRRRQVRAGSAPPALRARRRRARRAS